MQLRTTPGKNGCGWRERLFEWKADDFALFRNGVLGYHRADD
jgi:hypothetical protein